MRARPGSWPATAVLCSQKKDHRQPKYPAPPADLAQLLRHEGNMQNTRPILSRDNPFARPHSVAQWRTAVSDKRPLKRCYTPSIRNRDRNLPSRLQRVDQLNSPAPSPVRSTPRHVMRKDTIQIILIALRQHTPKAPPLPLRQHPNRKAIRVVRHHQQAFGKPSLITRVGPDREGYLPLFRSGQGSPPAATGCL